MILESSRGKLDASVETQLAEIERGFADLVRRALMNLAPYHRETQHASRPAAGPERSPRWSGCWSSRTARRRRSAISAKSARATAASIRTQVIGFRDGRVLSMPLEETDGLQLGDPIVGAPGRRADGGGPAAAGPGARRIRQADGRLGPIGAAEAYDLYAAPPGPLEREPITEPLVTGIRAIDSLLTCGKGQRIGIFGGSGVGKSTLLGAMARYSSADVSVIALIGERNREVRDFIEHELGPDGLKRSVLVVATSDRPAPLRIRAAFVALAVAEYFRDQGKDVLLVMDSVTRLAMAQREIGLAAGEPPSQKGYTPSVFNLLPKIFERAGQFRKGSITGFFTVLVEGDDFNEPICDAVRAILDGHIVLSRATGRGRPLSGHRRLAIGQPAGSAACARRSRKRRPRRSGRPWRRTSAPKT